MKIAASPVEGVFEGSRALAMAMAPSDPADPRLDLGSLLGPLVRHGVDFVVIGGVAGLAQGSSYPTYDLDVAYSRDHANLERLVEALHDLEVNLRGAPSDLPFLLEVRTLESGANFTFDTDYGKFDILGDVEGSGGYDTLREKAVVARVAGSEVRVASIDHLIAMKRAANRPKDRNMVEEYIVLADEIRRQEDEENPS
ncbi:MAG TPA: hypothetical protein VFN92_06180 [Solirubrobacterales bacterium]|nr:hypothetical protein [Solirubrobacterales bacterium]